MIDNKSIWAIGCIILILATSLINGISIFEMIKNGYNPIVHTSITINTLVVFGGILLMYKHFIKGVPHQIIE